MRFLAAILLLLFALPVHAQGLSQALVVSSCGTPTLTIGGQVQMTMDTTGRLCSHKTGSGVSPPVISVAPVASGSLTVGSTLSCTTGTWTNSPTGYAYTWLRGGTPISGATSATYLTVSADGGTSVGCSVIASNAGGNSSPSASNTLAIAAASGCVAATNYLARTTSGTEGGNAANITTLICGLVTDGVITGNLSGARGCGSHLDALYILAQQNQADALLNLCGTSYGVTNVASIPFTSYQGFTGAGGGTYMDTGFDPTTATSPNFTQNNASIGAWVSNSRTSPGPLTALGNNGGPGSAILWPLASAGVMEAAMNDTTYQNSTTTVPNSRGLSVADRAISTSFVFYKNGASLETETVTTTGLASFTIYLMAINNSNSPLQSSTDTFVEAHIGGSLGSTLELALYNRLRTYMTAVGVP